MKGLGTDLVEIGRLRAALDRTPGLRQRLFTAGELDDVGSRRDPLPGLAARFAAKEAVMKAMGVGFDRVPFTTVEVRSGDGGAPRVELSGAAAARAAELGVTAWHVSLTHTEELAQAVVLAE